MSIIYKTLCDKCKAHIDLEDANRIVLNSSTIMGPSDGYFLCENCAKEVKNFIASEYLPPIKAHKIKSDMDKLQILAFLEQEKNKAYAKASLYSFNQPRFFQKWTEFGQALEKTLQYVKLLINEEVKNDEAEGTNPKNG